MAEPPRVAAVQRVAATAAQTHCVPEGPTLVLTIVRASSERPDSQGYVGQAGPRE